MNPSRLFVLIVSFSVAPVSTSVLRAAADASYTRQEDVIYGRKHGTALTMDVFTPKQRANGAAVVDCVSGGWFSAHRAINPGLIRPLVDRGYTVFAVVHGSQPKFTIPEVLEDMHRAGCKLVMTTHDTEEAAMNRVLARFAKFDTVIEPPRMIRIEPLAK